MPEVLDQQLHLNESGVLVPHADLPDQLSVFQDWNPTSLRAGLSGRLDPAGR
jgi:hypothetical protein